MGAIAALRRHLQRHPNCPVGLARTAEGKLFSWGANMYGQLGLRELGVGAGEHNVGEMRKYWDHEHSPKPIEAGALAPPKGKAVAPWLKK